MPFYTECFTTYVQTLVLKNCSAPEDYEFGSPLMDIRISPMLCLSNDALAVLCGYLGKSE